MVTLRSGFAAALLLLFGCSSTAFEVGQADATDDVADGTAGDSAIDGQPPSDSTTADTGSDTSLKPDTGVGSDTGPAPDTGTVPDTGVVPDTKVDAVIVDVGCALGTTKACECGGIRTCGADGTYGMCHDTCLPSPFRFICAYGKGTCTSDTCFDSNNCSAKCGCSAAPGSTCALTDPCWSVVCNGFVCPS